MTSRYPKTHCKLNRHNYTLMRTETPNRRDRDQREIVIYRCRDCNKIKAERWS